MLAYMGTVLVILLNILIAQMSTTYIQAKKVARVEYDVDRILQLTRMERFPFLVRRRADYGFKKEALACVVTRPRVDGHVLARLQLVCARETE